MIVYIKRVLFPYVESVRVNLPVSQMNQPAFAISDVFTAHRNEIVLWKLKKAYVRYVFVPAGWVMKAHNIISKHCEFLITSFTCISVEINKILFVFLVVCACNMFLKIWLNKFLFWILLKRYQLHEVTK